MRIIIIILSAGLLFSGLSFSNTNTKILKLKGINTTILYNLKNKPSSVSWMLGYSIKLQRFCRSIDHCNNSKVAVKICKAQPSSFRKSCLDGVLGFCNECVGLKNVLKLLHDKCKNKLTTSQDCRIYYGFAEGDANQVQYFLKPFD